MSKFTNNGLTRSGTGCFIAVPIWQQWALKGLVTCNRWIVDMSYLRCYMMQWHCPS